jgi:methylated-DNA-protein-cysteine methyltransferase-like protein
MSIKASSNFANKVYQIVSSIPNGKVMTYGQIAALAGNARASRIVGGIAHFGPQYLPWHRVVKKDGFLASGFPGGGRDLQKKLLEDEGIKFYMEYKIKNFKRKLYLK